MPSLGSAILLKIAAALAIVPGNMMSQVQFLAEIIAKQVIYCALSDSIGNFGRGALRCRYRVKKHHNARSRAVFADKQSSEGLLDRRSSTGKALLLLAKRRFQSRGTQIAAIAACSAGY
jgi:hypothetical protein